jgi:hypothetical protein
MPQKQYSLSQENWEKINIDATHQTLIIQSVLKMKKEGQRKYVER